MSQVYKLAPAATIVVQNSTITVQYPEGYRHCYHCRHAQPEGIHLSTLLIVCFGDWLNILGLLI
jgi:hypothetical protein